MSPGRSDSAARVSSAHRSMSAAEARPGLEGGAPRAGTRTRIRSPSTAITSAS